MPNFWSDHKLLANSENAFKFLYKLFTFYSNIISIVSVSKIHIPND